MARKFSNVLNAIVKVAPKELGDKLQKAAYHWKDPKNCLHSLELFIKRNVKQSSTDETSVKIYAILYNCKPEEMKAHFEADGL